jgi:hypothetical protein
MGQRNPIRTQDFHFAVGAKRKKKRRRSKAAELFG